MTDHEVEPVEDHDDFDFYFHDPDYLASLGLMGCFLVTAVSLVVVVVVALT